MQLKTFFLADDENTPIFLPLIFNFLLNIAGFGLFLPALGLSFSTNPLPFSSNSTGFSFLFFVAEFIALFGLGQFVGLVLIKKFLPSRSIRALILSTTIVSFLGYVMISGAFFSQKWSFLLLGRFLTGLGAGNTKLCLRLSWDLHPEKSHPHLLSYLMGISAISFLIGPWFGMKLLNPDWLGWSTPSTFFAFFYALNLLFLFVRLPHTKSLREKASPIKEVLMELLTLLAFFRCQKLFWLFILFLGGWVTFLISFPALVLQKWQVDWSSLCDLYAYFAASWLLGTLFIFPELKGKISSSLLVNLGLWVLASSVLLCFLVPYLYWYWLLIPLCSIAASFLWSYIGEIGNFGFFKEVEGRILWIFLLIFSLVLLLIPITTGWLLQFNVIYPLIFSNLQFLLLALVGSTILKQIKKPPLG